MNDIYNLKRFVDEQDDCYEGVLHQLRAGRKTGHWIWYIFPQIKGLSYSSMSRKYAISSLQEAEAYAAHPLLGLRLRECTQLVINVQGRNIEDIFDHPDYLKFRSSMTLFMAATSDNELFEAALKKYFEGKPDQRTLEILKGT